MNSRSTATGSENQTRRKDMQENASTGKKVAVNRQKPLESGSATSFVAPAKPSTANYPLTLSVPHKDRYIFDGGVAFEVADPFRWLEEDSKERSSWIEAQEKLTRRVLDPAENRKDLERTIRSAFQYERFWGLSFQSDNRWYWHYIQGSTPRSKLYRSADDKLPLKDDRLVGSLYFDFNQLSLNRAADIYTWSISPNGEHFAYAVSLNQQADLTIYVRRTNRPFLISKKHNVEEHEGYLPNDVVEHARFTEIAWTKDSKGFFYQKHEQNKYKLYYHRLATGTSLEIDKMVLEVGLKNKSKPDKADEFDNAITWTVHERFLRTTPSFLVVSVCEGTKPENKVWICELDDPGNADIGSNLEWKRIIDDFRREQIPICNVGTKFYFMTSKSKVTVVDTKGTVYENKDLILEEKDAVLQDCVVFHNNMLAIVKKKKLYDELHVYSLTTNSPPMQLQKSHQGVIELNTASLDPSDPRIIVGLRKFTEPIRNIMYNATKGLADAKAVSVTRTKLENYNPSDLVIENVEYVSQAEKKVIPMSIVRHKSVARDGTAHALLYGYGGFGLCVDQGFQPDIIPCLSRYKIIFAVAYIRGGGELGEKWHRAGKGFQKKTSFLDFASAAEFLVKEKYTSDGKIGLLGASNGGLLVAATYNIVREGLIGAAISKVALTDMLRYKIMNEDPGWEDEYTDPKDPTSFRFLRTISPYHVLAKYHAPFMLMTGYNDPTLNPAHSFKHVAKLQKLDAEGNDRCLLRLDKDAGHGTMLTTKQEIEQAVDMWCFFIIHLGLKRIAPSPPTQPKTSSPSSSHSLTKARS